jgi:dihydroorotate dehydrogenase
MLVGRRAELEREHGHKPIFIKIAPDLDEEQIGIIAALLPRHGIDGVIATNTTVSRHGVHHLPNGQETGGLSGMPLLAGSNRVIRLLRAALGKAYPIIGVGGVMSAADAKSKIKAGANLVQIYTGLIYRGPGLVTEVARALKGG